jgi:hypothetical protein
MGVFGLPSSSEKLAGRIAWGSRADDRGDAGSVLSRTGALIRLTLENATARTEVDD